MDPNRDRVESSSRIHSLSQIVRGQEPFDVEKFVCSICQDLIEPDQLCQTFCCDNFFCERCIVPWISKQPSCPLDRAPMKTVKKASRVVRNMLNNVKVLCPHNPTFPDSSFGNCAWSGAANQLQHHLSRECIFSLVRCPNQCSSKHQTGAVSNTELYSRDQLKEHLKSCGRGSRFEDEQLPSKRSQQQQLQCARTIDAAAAPMYMGPHEDDETLLLRATANGDVALVQALLAVERSEEHLLQRSNDECGWTALMHASNNGYTKLVELLLECSASEAHVMAQSESGWTALMLASRNGNVAVVKQLLHANASALHVMARSRKGSTALMIASCKGHLQVVKLLLDANCSEEHLMAQEERGWSALMWASYRGRVEVVEAILHRNASVEHCALNNTNGQTAADIARHEHNHNVLTLLR